MVYVESTITHGFGHLKSTSSESITCYITGLLVPEYKQSSATQVCQGKGSDIV